MSTITPVYTTVFSAALDLVNYPPYDPTYDYPGIPLGSVPYSGQYNCWECIPNEGLPFSYASAKITPTPMPGPVCASEYSTCIEIPTPPIPTPMSATPEPRLLVVICAWVFALAIYRRARKLARR